MPAKFIPSPSDPTVTQLAVSGEMSEQEADDLCKEIASDPQRFGRNNPLELRISIGTTINPNVARVIAATETKSLTIKAVSFNHRLNPLSGLAAIMATDQLEELKLKDVKLRDEGAIFLSKILQPNKSIKSLDLCNCEIADLGALALIQGAHSVTSLDLTINDIADTENVKKSARNRGENFVLELGKDIPLYQENVEAIMQELTPSKKDSDEKKEELGNMGTPNTSTRPYSTSAGAASNGCCNLL